MWEVKFKAEADDSETCSLCVCVSARMCLHACASGSVYVCEGEYATQAQPAQRYSLQWWLLIHMFALQVVPHHSIEFLLQGVPLPLNRSCHQGRWNVRGWIFSAFCLSICTNSLRQPRCSEMSALYCSINMISLPAPHLFPLMLSRSIAVLVLVPPFLTWKRGLDLLYFYK